MQGRQLHGQYERDLHTPTPETNLYDGFASQSHLRAMSDIAIPHKDRLPGAAELLNRKPVMPLPAPTFSKFAEHQAASGAKFFLPRVGAALLDPGFDLVVGSAGVVEVDAEVGFGHGLGGAFYLVLAKIDSNDDESFGLGALDLNHSISRRHSCS